MMRKALKRNFKQILARLDGAPTDSKGQSLMELTMTMPILLFMLLGLVEVGWLANNYLTLIDISREAARFGSVRDPEDLWDNGHETIFEHMDCDEEQGTFNNFKSQSPPLTEWPGDKDRMMSYGYTHNVETTMGYYDNIACTVLANMSPLVFDDSRDDVVVSVFSYAVDPGTGTEDPEVRVIGRWPPLTNECTTDSTGDYRDPFLYHTDLVGNDMEDAGAEYVRGYVFRGNHEIENMDTGALPCLGSEFSLREVERALNAALVDESGWDVEDEPPIWDDDDPPIIPSEEISEVNPGGLVLVEIFWNHEQLLGLPFFRLLGDPTELHVWSMFPVSAAEPAEEDINWAP
jgi:hypothetical protein